MDLPIWYAVSAQVIKRKLWTIKIYNLWFENNVCVLFQGNIKTEDDRKKLKQQNLSGVNVFLKPFPNIAVMSSILHWASLRKVQRWWDYIKTSGGSDGRGDFLDRRGGETFVSSVRSSYSHPNLLLTPLFQITSVLNTGLSLSEPLQLYKGHKAI